MWNRLVSYISYLWNSYDKIPMLIELLLIGFIVYSVMKFLRGTGGAKLFKGIVFLILGVLGISLIKWSLNLDLERIGWLVKYFAVALLVVATVAFQQEIRRGLMRLGGTRLGHSAAPETVAAIEQIVDAVSAMSRSKIGALIALEREVGLADFMRTGTAVDSEVSADLLHTIFWPGTPLHDMGVVIREGRIASAGVQFPLAEHGEFDRTLGSRHRAAIGLSKETDAAIVVVSEETGQISLALHGKLARFLTIEQLRQQLLDLMLPSAPESGEKKDKSAKGEASESKSNPVTDETTPSKVQPRDEGV
ncbi:MAG: diadenylate cyclase CdaA [Sedimentisphaerales bacterium]|nr:diadenylate cyclase CdaA [Sedimentisphaerales bacterium]